ncbi:homoserine kinase [Mumia sp. zg.B53]|uniref:homoserine kinase n=1 Tax=unclassified Mumia TaxID=2621872 RepID=UPI001C6F4A80|nr:MULTISPECIES: homoserine kinase [unclassified Mumia]MBW9206608.1 homoserine kinase [Mumia sp. zg.B17]MBW9215670.1 homoserine kinase [Mumia sp. zg.B53]
MSPFVSGPVTVVTPASSANLGPGYDTLGLGLGLYDEVTAEVVDGSGLEVTVEGVGADDVPRDESHLVVRALRAVFDEAGLDQPGLRVRCLNRIPHARGLGSSSAAIVGGISAARALLTATAPGTIAPPGAVTVDDASALQLATRIEGHPDNVAAALLGGLTIAWDDGARTRAVRLDVQASVVAFVPPDGVSTEVARGLLPDQVPHADAARNAGRAALLVAAFDGRPELLLDATEDALHQAYRAPAMPASYALVQELRADGVPAIISGAGPTVLAFATDIYEAAPLVGRAPEGWAALPLEIAARGACRA